MRSWIHLEILIVVCVVELFEMEVWDGNQEELVSGVSNAGYGIGIGGAVECDWCDWYGPRQCQREEEIVSAGYARCVMVAWCWLRKVLFGELVWVIGEVGNLWVERESREKGGWVDFGCTLRRSRCL